MRCSLLKGIVTVTFLSVSLVSFAQLNERKFDAALKLYQEAKFIEAAEKFRRIPLDKAILFTGKSYFGATEYLKAKQYLTRYLNLPEKEQELRKDGQYSLALTHFELNQFTPALELLQPIGSDTTAQVDQASALYSDLLRYLTPAQRKQVFQSTSSDLLRYDLVASSFEVENYATATSLVEILRESLTPDSELSSLDIEKLESKLQRNDSLRAVMNNRASRYPNPPKNIAYNIGVALPSFEPETREFAVAQSLYFGFQLACEEFNQRNPYKKVFLEYQNTNNPEQTTAQAITDQIWRSEIDAILGPLFSESASSIEPLAEMYQVSVLAPLANSDTLNSDNPYLYQLNPTFEVRGRQMAEYAVQTLGLDTLAVIVEKNSLGARSAYAFRNRAEQLGAFVPYLFIDDFEEKGYDLSDYSDYFSRDSVLIDSLNIIPPNGIYAPFTGQAASIIIDLFMTDLEASRNYLPIFGSEEWKNSGIDVDRLKRFDIYHTESFQVDTTRSGVSEFMDQYSQRFNTEPTLFSLLGFDTADYLLKNLEMVGNPAYLKRSMKSYPAYRGLSMDIAFEGYHINQRVSIKKLQPEEEQ